MQSTIILVHGVFAESSSWDHVTETLLGEGHRVIAYANPLRAIASDAAGLTELVRSVEGPKRRWQSAKPSGGHGACAVGDILRGKMAVPPASRTSASARGVVAHPQPDVRALSPPSPAASSSTDTSTRRHCLRRRHQPQETLADDREVLAG
jgi:hypothetical protein